MRLYKVGEADGFSSSGSSCAAVLCWFGGLRRDASLLLLSPYPPPSPCHPGILLSIYSSFNVSIFARNGSCLWLCVNKSRVPLKASCCCNFLRCLVTFCIRWDILSGPVGGLVGGQLLSCGLFLCFFCCCFSISDCKERILVAGLHTDLVRGTKTEKE